MSNPTPEELAALNVILPYDLVVNEDLAKGTKAEGVNMLGVDDWENIMTKLDEHGIIIKRRD